MQIFFNENYLGVPADWVTQQPWILIETNKRMTYKDNTNWIRCYSLLGFMEYPSTYAEGFSHNAGFYTPYLREGHLKRWLTMTPTLYSVYDIQIINFNDY